MNTHTICLLSDSFPPVMDGVANVVMNYGNWIEKNHGHSVVVTPSVPGAVTDEFPYPILHYPSVDTRKILGYVSGVPFSSDIYGRLKEEKVELLHTHAPATSCIFGREIQKVLDVPMVLTYHTQYDVEIRKALRSQLLQKSAIRALVHNVNACDEVWVVSRGAGENLRSLGYEGDYVVMENGVDIPREAADPQLVEQVTGKYDLPADVPVLLFVGRLVWHKGLRIIIDALTQYKEQGGRFRMVFVGDGMDGDEVRKYAERLGDSCIFIGAEMNRNNLRAWYTRGDLFLFPSTFDTNGLVVREAAACGTASVVIEGSCAAEGVTDMRNGFLIEENADSLAAMVKQVCERPELMRRVGEFAQQELYLSWEDAVARANDRYEIVLDNYRSGRYKKRYELFDGFLTAQGELMDFLSEIKDPEHWEYVSELYGFDRFTYDSLEKRIIDKKPIDTDKQ